MTQPLTIVSLDSHTQVPESAWADYLEPSYHDLLPRLSNENQKWIAVMGKLMVDRINEQIDVFDPEGMYGEGFRGVVDCDVRLAQMDREGIAGEFIYNGEPRQVALFFQQTSSRFDLDAREAGARAHHRWVHDTFGGASDRIFLTGVTGHAPCHDMEATLAETRWIADHGFVATMAPGSTGAADHPPLYDEYWEPLWSLCEERGLTLVVHAGYGTEAGPFFSEVADVYDEMQAAGALTDELLARFSTSTMVKSFFNNLDTRRPLWQLTLGGVFDRHPDLKLLLTEIRADWLPAMLAHLDGIFEQHRDDLPATRRPSEYWHSNGTTCLSFAHKAEVEMRHEIGVETIAFGRDYPHPEGTWPNTREWMREAFAGVPEPELRMMLGENAIRRMGLDAERLTQVAQRVGPTVAELMGGGPEVTPELIGHFDLRGGYLKPAEGEPATSRANVESTGRRDPPASRSGGPMIEIRPLGPAFGAEVTGFEPRVPLDDATTALLRDAFDEYGLLVFRDLDIAHPAQVYLSKLLIRREHEPDDAPGRPPITDGWYISNQREEAAAPFGRLQFHADGMCDETSFEVLSLYGTEVGQPATPTTFVSAVHAWQTLPPELRTRVDGLRAFHTSGAIRRRDVTDVLVIEVERPRTSVKPLALVHPRTGETVLFACEQMTQEIVDLEADESEGLLGKLFDHMYDPAVRLDHEWRERDLVVWDNIAVQHARPNVVAGGPPRTLRKTGYPMPTLTPDQMPTYGGTR